MALQYAFWHPTSAFWHRYSTLGHALAVPEGELFVALQQFAISVDGLGIALEQLANEGRSSGGTHQEANRDSDEDDECDNNCAGHGPSVP